ncbi:hypothetical protein GCM10009584_13800 [Ornithinimicrobium humiphilum]|uniref:Uncharacterized protein n=1 Tax=Ornithinimicrobium humiphilum TaxID=125288 RepID=A0A543KK75_9MICO|nr:hypothetical protein [Ornithinimicrobium humiphilum]TQM95475.1 hypothetical protein FB476_0318 [Ornithinimicrobium humiphilum]
MDDTTKWIMIILLLLLIAAAVFMLLRSPGKDNGDGDADSGSGGATGTPDRATDRLTSPEREDRDVYDQDADLRASEAAPAAGAGAGAAAIAASGAGSTHQADDADEPFPNEPGDYDADRTDDADLAPTGGPQVEDPSLYDEPVDDEPVAPADVPPTHFDDGTGHDPENTSAGWDQPDQPATDVAPMPGTAEVTPLTDADVDEGASEEPLTRGEQEPVDLGADEAPPAAYDDGPSYEAYEEPPVPEAPVSEEPPGAEAPVEQSFGDEAPAQASDDDASGEEYPVGDSTTYRAAGGEAVVVDDEGPWDADARTEGDDRTWEQTHAGPVDDLTTATATATDTTDAGDTGTSTQEPVTGTGWDTPADGGTDAPETADDIVARADHGPDTTDDGAGAPAAAPLYVDPDAPAVTPTAEPAPASDATAGSWDSPASEDTAPAVEDTGAAPVFSESVYGAGSAEPLPDGSGPAGWEIKGNVGSMLFHTPESPSYDSVRAEVWFESEEAARAAGFAHWDRRRR